MRTELTGMIIDQLSQDPQLQSAFPGGIFDRLPKAGKGPGSTPNAFYTEAENPLQSGKLKPTLAVLDGGDVPAPAGEVLAGYQAFPWVYAYVKPDATGESALRQLELSLRTRYRRDISYVWHDASEVEIIVLERAPLLDGDDVGYPDRYWTRWRLQATTVRLLSQL